MVRTSGMSSSMAGEKKRLVLPSVAGVAHACPHPSHGTGVHSDATAVWSSQNPRGKTLVESRKVLCQSPADILL